MGGAGGGAERRKGGGRGEGSWGRGAGRCRWEGALCGGVPMKTLGNRLQ